MCDKELKLHLFPILNLKWTISNISWEEISYQYICLFYYSHIPFAENQTVIFVVRLRGSD
jgi:hypothetical protein